jgi:hypothetical protein
MRGNIDEGPDNWVWFHGLPCGFDIAATEIAKCSALGWPETKCPDLGDWSDTPHDQLDEKFHVLWMMIDAIKLDELSVKGYNNT